MLKRFSPLQRGAIGVGLALAAVTASLVLIQPRTTISGHPSMRTKLMKDTATATSTWSNDFVKPSDAELKVKLTAIQYKVTQHEGTEGPYRNEFWDNKAAGLYVDIVSGEPLFSSKDKFVSGTGWPSFTRAVDESLIVEKTDRRLFSVRTEVRSKHADSHLGHVFEDGPRPTGLRYCINSAALHFIPFKDLEKEGYGQFVPMFK